MRYFIGSAIVAILISACMHQAAFGQVRFVNLSKENLYLATWVHQPSTKGPKGNEDGWWYSGWTTIAPGTLHEVAAGPYHLMNNAGPVTWKLENSKGVIRPRGPFRVFLSKESFNADVRKLLPMGFREAQYQRFEKGEYTWGTDYRLENQKFDFAFNSAEKKKHKRTFNVPGRVLSYDLSVAENKGGRFQWSQDTNAITATGTTEGAPSGFRGRLRATYRGTVTVHYLRE